MPRAGTFVISKEEYRPTLSRNFWEFPGSPEGREVSSLVAELAGTEDAGTGAGNLILPFLTLCAASALAGEEGGIRSDVLLGAATIELLGRAVLGHDELLVARTLRAASDLGAKEAALVAEAVEAGNRCDRTRSADGYFANLFGVAARMGALLQRVPERKQRAFEEFGRSLGAAFQILADVAEAEEAEARSTAADLALSGIAVIHGLESLNVESVALLERLTNDVVLQLDRFDPAPSVSA